MPTKLIMKALALLLTLSSLQEAYGNYSSTYTKKARIEKALTCNLNIKCLKDIKTSLKQNAKEGIYNLCKVKEEQAKTCCGGGVCASDSDSKKTKDFFSSIGTPKTMDECSHYLNQFTKSNDSMCSLERGNCSRLCGYSVTKLKNKILKCFSLQKGDLTDFIKEASKGTSACSKTIASISKQYKKLTLNKRTYLSSKSSDKELTKCRDLRPKALSEIKNSKALPFLNCREDIKKAELKQKEQDLSSSLYGNKDGGSSKKLKTLPSKEEREPAIIKKFHSLNESEKRDFMQNKYPHLTRAEQKTIRDSDEIMNWTREDDIKRTKENKAEEEEREYNKLSSRAKRMLAGAVALGGAGINKVAGLVSGDAKAQTCPVSPKIQSAIVYQSVEAPQIETMSNQELQQDPNNPVFKSYDLVMGKPAGVLIKLDKSEMDATEEFEIEMSLRINEKVISVTSSCFHESLNGNAMKKGDETSCSFTRKEFHRPKLNKFIPLPMDEAPLNNHHGKDAEVTLSLYPKNTKKLSCDKEKKFLVNIKRTPDLKLGFTGIHSKSACKGKYTHSLKVQMFEESKEVSEYIPSVFPVTKITSATSTSILGTCDNTYALEHTRTFYSGLLRDVDALAIKRHSEKFDKIIAVVPESYITFHLKRTDIAGFVVRPRQQGVRREFLFFNWGSTALAGNWNVAFIKDSLFNINRGIIAHELAHTLGQGKEHYFRQDKLGKPIIEQCKVFNGSKTIDCYTHKISRGLHALINKSTRVPQLKFVKNRWGIMNNRGNINKQWIDRDTHQKIFSTLLNFGAIIKQKGNLFRLGESDRKVVISGFYNINREGEHFVASKTRVLARGIHAPSLQNNSELKAPFLTFKLAQVHTGGEEPITSVKRPALPMEITTIYKNGTKKTEHFAFSHTIAAFKIPRDSHLKNYKIHVSNSKDEVIHTTDSFVIGRQTGDDE